MFFGTSWMLCGSVALLNENIWSFLDYEWGDCENGCTEVFWKEGSDRPLCKISIFTVTPLMLFVHNYHNFDKYLTEISFSEFVANFSPVSSRFIRFNQIWANLDFFNLGNPQCLMLECLSKVSGLIYSIHPFVTVSDPNCHLCDLVGPSSGCRNF